MAVLTELPAMKLPARLTILDFAVCLDGGTTAFRAAGDGLEHTVTLTQYMSPRLDSSTGALPGRLYLDGQLVPMRSDVEATILSLLRSAEVADDLTRAFVAKTIRFVESDEYLAFAERVEQAADEALYDVWVEWSPETFSRAVVAVKQVLGVGYKEAREVVEQGSPVARGLSAPDVVLLAGRYRAAGLSVRVSPEFRWGLP